jgi:hypothetical protein
MAASRDASSKPGYWLASRADVVANAVTKAASARRPRTRYVVGFGAKPLICTRRLTPDRALMPLSSGPPEYPPELRGPEPLFIRLSLNAGDVSWSLGALKRMPNQPADVRNGSRAALFCRGSGHVFAKAGASTR